MANPYTPFNDDVRDDIIETIKYINGLKSKMAKIKEDMAVAENWLKETLNLDAQKPGTAHFGDKDGISVSFEISPTHKVDGEVIESLVKEKKVSAETVEKLVSWAPNLIAKEWKTTDEQTKKILSSAITTTYEKPTMKIEIKES